MSKKAYVFGYGSLVSVDSAFVTLGRRVQFYDHVELKGWVRDWSVIIPTGDSRRHAERFRRGEVPPYIAALNVRPPRGEEVPTNPNGVLIEVNDIDLANLDQRESHYRRIDVTNDIAYAPGIVYTYTGLEQFLDTPDHTPMAYIPNLYEDIVIRGFSTVSQEAYGRYTASTRSPELAFFYE